MFWVWVLGYKVEILNKNPKPKGFRVQRLGLKTFIFGFKIFPVPFLRSLGFTENGFYSSYRMLGLMALEAHMSRPRC